MKVLITGYRNYDRDDYVDSMFRSLQDGVRTSIGVIRLLSDVTVIHGGAPGADTLGGRVADKYGYQVRVFNADWNQHGRAAGPIRNREMFKALIDEDSNDINPNILIAFHHRLMSSKGTKDMVQYALTGLSKIIHKTTVILVWGNPMKGQYTELPIGCKLSNLQWAEVRI